MFERIQDLITFTANKEGIKRQLDAALICSIAREVIESDYPKLSDYSTVRFFKNNTLYIGTKNSIVSQEFLYKQAEIIDLINQRLDSNPIQKLSLTLNRNSLD